jgi:tRNA splicing endonuclease
MEATEHGARTPTVLEGKAVPLPPWVSVKYFMFSDLHGRGFSGNDLLRFGTLYVNTDMSVDCDICS